LHQFASEWKVITKQKEDVENDENEDEVEELESYQHNILQLIDSSMTIQKRKTPAVIKTPHVSVNDNPSEYYYSLLLLYVPFRKESDLLVGFTDVEQAYTTNFNGAAQNPYLKQIDQIDQINRALELIAALNESDRNIRELIVNENDSQFNEFERAGDEVNDEISDFTCGDEQTNRFDFSQHNKLNASISDRAKLLNEKQKLIYDKVRSKLSNKDNKQLLQMLHGSGGTGKSFVAHIIKDLINLHSNTLNGNMNQRHVIVSAPTGVAAKNIHGITNHQAFMLPIEKFSVGSFKSLKGLKIFLG
jgi:hypothetical protein